MSRPNPDSIKSVDSHKVAHLGQKLGDYPSTVHRGITWKIFGGLAGLVAIGSLAMIILGNISPWYLIGTFVLAFFCYLCFEKYRIFGLSLYEHGVVIFEDTEPAGSVYSWVDLELGETDWGDFSEFHFYDRNGEFIAEFNTDSVAGEKEVFVELLRSLPTDGLIEMWKEAFRRNEKVHYKNVTLGPKKVTFNKTKQFIEWWDFGSWTPSEDWEVIFLTETGRRIKPGLFSYEIPFIETLLHFAHLQKEAKRRGS